MLSIYMRLPKLLSFVPNTGYRERTQYNPCKKSYPVGIFLYCKETENALFNKRPRQWHKSIETGTSNLIKIWVSQLIFEC